MKRKGSPSNLRLTYWGPHSDLLCRFLEADTQRERRALRDELARRHLPLVRDIANSVNRQIVSTPTTGVDDLVSHGYMGLLRAIDRFDPNCGVKFHTYISRRVRGSMLDALRSDDWLPRQERKRQKEGEIDPPRINALADESDELLNDERPDTPDGSLQAMDFWRDALHCLDHTERAVIRMHYQDGMEMRRIGRELGLDESEADRIHQRSLQRMREHMVTSPA